jgi:two-component system sensor histidine kinase RpfC
MAFARHATPARFSPRALAVRLRARPDSEHEQALIRIVIVAALFALMSAGSGGTVVSPEHRAGALLAGGYLAVSIAYFLCTVIAPQASPTRRLIAMVTDFATTSAFLHFGDAAAAPFYPIYLWVTLGNGFRYGLPYLAASVSAAFSGFFMVVVTTPFWQDNMGLGLGLLAALVMIPSYTASLIRKLTEAKAQAEAASHAKSRFLASMSHELRTPLNAVIGVSETLRRSRLDDDQKEMVHTIRTAGGALLSLIEDILDLSRIEANKVSVAVEPFDLHRELGDLMAMLRPQAAAKAIALEVHVDAAAPHRLLGDRRHLRQILTNLVANAIKFTEAGHVLVSVGAPPARPHQGALLRFDVADTGIGIEIEQQERIFERFTQADETVERRYGGTGLGLAITRSLVALMDGTLSLTSKRGAGSTFSVELPFALADDRAEAGGALAGVALAPATLPERIIVVGADPALADEVRSALGSAPASTVSHALTVADAARLMGGGSPPARATAVQVIDAAAAGAAAAVAEGGRHGGCPRIRIAAACEPAAPPLGFVSTLARPIDGERLRRALAAAAALGRLDGAADHDGGEDKGSEAAARALSALVVEDNPINQKVTRRILEHAGHRVTVVGSGEDALDALDAGTFDVMIVDINMPGMSGLELIKLQRIAELGDRRLPIVALSADATPETRKACEDAGGDVYLTKPIEPARLLAALSDLTRGVAGADKVAAADGADRVTSIFSHPRYRAEPSAAINWQVIQGLTGFGDAEFVIETVDEYVVNTQALIAEIRVAVAAGDVSAFRAAVHALRGTSGNVGAEGLWRLTQDSAGMTVERLRQTGQDYVTRLTQELARFRNEFARFSASQRSGRS